MSRTQELSPKTGKKVNRLVIIIGIVFIVLSAIMISFYIYRKNQVPPFEENAKQGVPVVDENYSYSSLKTDFGYEINMAANLYRQADGSLNIYFTNVASNKVYMKVLIEDSKTGKTLYESGVLRPGEYVEALPPVKEVSNEAREADIYIYAYEADTYYSEGTTTLQMTIQAW